MRVFLLALLLLAIPVSGTAYEDDRSDPGFLEGPWTQDIVSSSRTVTWTTASPAHNITGAFDADAATLDFAVDGLDRLGLDLEAVLEFQDLDGDGRLSLGDPIVQRFAFADLRASSMRVDETDGATTVTVQYTGFSFNAPRLTVTLRLVGAADDHQAPTEAVLGLRIDSCRFQSDNATQAAIDLRGHRVLDLRGDAAVRESFPWLAYQAWGNETDPTLQPYGADGGSETLMVFSAPREQTLDETLTLGVLRLQEEEVIEPPGFLENLRLSDWRLWAIGVLVVGLVILVSTARQISRE